MDEDSGLGRTDMELQQRVQNMGYLSFLLDKRCWLKTLSWRIFSTIITIVLLTLFGLELRSATAVGLSMNVIKTLFLYIHERLWETWRAKA